MISTMNLILKTINIFFVIVITSLAVLTSCKRIDIRTSYALAHNSKEDAIKGKRLLQATYKKMGYDKLESVDAYEVNSVFKWKTFWAMMPMNALPGNKGNEINFKFKPKTFDGSVTFLEGRKEGKTYGIQSWQTYLKKPGESVKEVNSKRYNWGLATYHYLTESPMRLLGADIIRYAGETNFNGQDYDLVYVTWGKDEPHKEHDQWLIYINKSTEMIDLTEVTINDFFVPVPNGMKGATIQSERKMTSNGSYLPSFSTIQLGKPKRKSKYVYTFSMTDYKFDSFTADELYPLRDVEFIGDARPE